VYESPLTVSSSKIIWSLIVDSDVSCVNPPLTTEIFATAEPPPVFVFVKTISSPISYPEPPLSIINSVIPARPTSSTFIVAPVPPPVTVTTSPEL